MLCLDMINDAIEKKELEIWLNENGNKDKKNVNTHAYLINIYMVICQI